jgi:peptidoglycan/xylan/chitin deacetylase (PgdA/CDA1 family)
MTARIIVLHEVKAPDHLRNKMAWLVDTYDVVALSGVFESTQHGRPRVALTFDDGYQSWYDVAAPILEEFSVPAVFFVCSGFIGLRGPAAAAFCAQRLRRKTVLEPLDVGHLRDLAAHPLVEIGSHTMTHPDLRAVTDPAVLESEIGGDRRRLEDWTGRPVRWFAYPFGQRENTSAAARAYLERQGFEGAFTIVPAFAGSADRFAVGRDSLDLTAPIWRWRARLAGRYDALYRLKRWLTRSPRA